MDESFYTNDFSYPYFTTDEDVRYRVVSTRKRNSRAVGERIDGYKMTERAGECFVICYDRAC